MPSQEIRRGGRVAEGARLESVYAGNRIEGSNPSLSASGRILKLSNEKVMKTIVFDEIRERELIRAIAIPFIGFT
jgi:hypothetical protein